MRRIVFLALLALAGCGADGPPERPGTTVGVTVSGSIGAGITGGS